MFIDPGNIADPPMAPEMSPEEAAIMDQFKDYEAEQAPEPDQDGPAPSPLIPSQFRQSAPEPPQPTLPALELCVMNNIGTVFDQGTELTPEDVAAIKLVILRRASRRLQ